MSASEVIIRKFRSEDRQSVRDICAATALMGRPSSLFLEGDDIFADALTRYFTDFEPDTCFVAEAQGRVVGYVVGAKDVKVADKISVVSILPRLLCKAFLSGFFFKRRNLIFLASVARSVIKGEFYQKDYSHDYPATLHINVDACCRSFGVGTRLIEAYLVYLSSKGIKGVHFATLSERAAGFFKREGFEVLCRAPRSYLRHVLHKDFSVSVFGKKLI